MTLDAIYQPIQSQLKAAEELFIQALAVDRGLLGEMTRYVAQMPGKKIRPVLALLGSALMKTNGSTSTGRETPQERCGPGQPPTIRLAAAVEMIHTASLLHDDVIDEAVLRRGLPTLHAKWGDALSVLSGDYLYAKAFCLLSDTGDPRILSLMSNTARVVCEGEVAQIQRRFDLSLSRDQYLQIIQRKTASLMAAAAEAGALLGGASSAQASRLNAFGLNFGIAFQILDDIQDLIGEETVQGKSLGTDLTLGQMTLPLICLKETADSKTQETLSRCFNGDGNGSGAPEQHLDFLRAQAIQFQVPERCRQVAREHLDQARAALEVFGASPHKRSLEGLADYLIQ